MEDYHKFLIKRQNEILTKLETIKRDPKTPSTYKKWIEQTKQFIREGSVYV